MSEINLIYTSLKLLEFAIFLLFGYIISKSPKHYWKYAIFPIAVFAIVEGLRFGREIDYNEYYFRYINIGQNFNSEDYEFIFKLICYTWLQIEHIKQLPLQGNDTINSINPLNRPEYGRSTEE